VAALVDSQNDLEICGESGDLEGAAEIIRRRKPDLIVVDIGSEPANGIESVKRLCLEFPQLAVLVVSLYDEYLYAERAIRAGAKGYLIKQESTEVLLTAIRQVLRGGVYLSARMRELLLNKTLAHEPKGHDPSLGSLTDRELEVFMLLGSGKLNREIAKQMKVSVKTVDAYRAHIKQKLRLKNGMQLIRLAVLHAQPYSSAIRASTAT